MAEEYTNYNYFQPSQFKVRIERKRFGNLEFYCQRVAHPGLAVTGAPAPVSRLGTLAIPGDTLNYDELVMDVIIDEDFKGYSEIYNSLQQLTLARSNQDGQVPGLDLLETDIYLSIMSSANNIIKQFKYVNAIPTSLGAINFEATVADTDIVTFPITFRIDSFEILTA